MVFLYTLCDRFTQHLALEVVLQGCHSNSSAVHVYDQRNAAKGYICLLICFQEKASPLSSLNEFGDGTMKWVTSGWMDVCEQNVNLFQFTVT